ncbi:hypothetical protein HanRHA438_Chr09g0411051 [Helianthus annuus]|nr:hypothetical protein HanRHA438_Chr09g0411051 [Helianthus annuus]
MGQACLDVATTTVKGAHIIYFVQFGEFLSCFLFETLLRFLGLCFIVHHPLISRFVRIDLFFC